MLQQHRLASASAAGPPAGRHPVQLEDISVVGNDVVDVQRVATAPGDVRLKHVTLDNEIE